MDYSLLHIGTGTYFFNLRTSPSSYHVSAEAQSSRFICCVSIMLNSQGERATQAVMGRKGYDHSQEACHSMHRCLIPEQDYL